jgi:hypothetical protein
VKPPALKRNVTRKSTTMSSLLGPTAPYSHGEHLLRGYGKTSMLDNISSSKQAYRKTFHYVHVLMPSHSVASLKRNICKNHDRMYDDHG